MNSEIKEILERCYRFIDTATEPEAQRWEENPGQLLSDLCSTLAKLNEPGKGFDWGEFQPPFLYSEALGTIRDREGRLVAFVSWHPIGRHIAALMNGEGK